MEETLIAVIGINEQETEEWKRSRIVAWASIAPHLKKPQTPEEWMPLPGDKANKKKNKTMSARLKEINTITDPEERAKAINEFKQTVLEQAMKPLPTMKTKR